MPNSELAVLEDVPALGRPELAEEISTWNDNYSAPAGWERIESGSYRRIYAHPDDPAVVYKVARYNSDEHMQVREVQNVVEIGQTHPDLCPYLPAIYAYQTSSGKTVVVMERLNTPRYEVGGKEQLEIKRKFYNLVADLHTKNFGQRADGQLVVLDFGDYGN